ncbi:MAG TPA: efflux RND transporter periplasmic adaptor subunit [Rubricoccaceae bacterium]|nr:efflux RND transporter periplasmic adaptor subunit [Rubricoccaceae bacterium]
MTSTAKKAIWIGVGVAALGALAYPKVFGGDEGEGGPGEGPGGRGGRGGDTLTVTVAPVVQELLEDRITTTGALLADEAVEVRAEVAGRITALPFREGGYVRRGQLLAALDTDVLEAEVRAARTRRDLAATQARRQRQLFEIGGLSRAALDEAVAEVGVLDAELARLRAEIERRRIYAPFAGQVGLRGVSVGAYVSPGDPIATLRVTSALKLEFTVPERYLGRVEEGSPVVFTVPGQEGTFRATIYAVEPAVDPATRAFTVRARTGSAGVLRPGAFAEVELVFDAIENAVLVPTVAVVPGADSAQVYVVRAGKAMPQPVGTGVRTADQIQITSGLAVGDTVLTSGMDEVRPGQPVRFTRSGFDPTQARPPAPAEAPGAYRPATRVDSPRPRR